MSNNTEKTTDEYVVEFIKAIKGRGCHLREPHILEVDSAHLEPLNFEDRSS